VPKLAALYDEPALPPASPWLGAKPPARPTARLGRDAATDEPVVNLAPGANEKAWLWTVRSEQDGVWTTEIVPGAVRTHRLPGRPDRVFVTAVSRTGVESAVVTATTAAATPSVSRGAGSRP
jgi:hypothetical protein